jgi:uncharacterized protein YejL (UPF0352 family)
MEADAERRILAQIETYYPQIAECLEKLEPLEALALMGNIMADTLARFPLEQRLQMANAWTTTLLEGVQENVDAAGKKRRD